MDRQVFHVPHLSEALKKQGVPLLPVIRAGDLVFVGGIPPIDPATDWIANADVSCQTEFVLDGIRAALDAAVSAAISASGLPADRTSPPASISPLGDA